MSVFNTAIDFGSMGEQDVDVHYKYIGFSHPGGTTDPPEYPYCTICAVFFRGIDVLDCLIQEEIESLEDQAMRDFFDCF